MPNKLIDWFPTRNQVQGKHHGLETGTSTVAFMNHWTQVSRVRNLGSKERHWLHWKRLYVTQGSAVVTILSHKHSWKLPCVLPQKTGNWLPLHASKQSVGKYCTIMPTVSESSARGKWNLGCIKIQGGMEEANMHLGFGVGVSDIKA